MSAVSRRGFDWDPTAVLGISPLEVEEKTVEEDVNINFASAFVGARVVEVSSEESGAEAENVLFETPELVWRSREAAPQWFIVQLIPAGVFPSLGLGRDVCKSIGWISSGDSRPTKVMLHVSADCQNWRQLTQVNTIQSNALIDLKNVYCLRSEPFLRFTVTETANNGPCRLKTLLCLGHEAKFYQFPDDDNISTQGLSSQSSSEMEFKAHEEKTSSKLSERVAAVVASEARQRELFAKLDKPDQTHNLQKEKPKFPVSPKRSPKPILLSPRSSQQNEKATAQLQRQRDADYAKKMEEAIKIRAQAEKDAARAKFDAARAKTEAERITLLRRSLVNDAAKQRIDSKKKKKATKSIGTSTRPAPRTHTKGTHVAIRPESAHVAVATNPPKLRHSASGTTPIQCRHSSTATEAIQLRNSSTATDSPPKKDVALSCIPQVPARLSVHTQVFPPQLWHAATQCSDQPSTTHHDISSYLKADDTIRTMPSQEAAGIYPPTHRPHIEELGAHPQVEAEEKNVLLEAAPQQEQQQQFGRETIVLAQVLAAKIAERRRKRAILLKETLREKLKERNEKAIELYSRLQNQLLETAF